MPRDRIFSSIFLMLVLVLGFVSYPSSFPSIGLVFADDDCDDLKGTDKADCIKKEKDDDDKGKSKDKNEKAVKASDDDDDDDDDDKGKSKDKNEKAVKASDREDDDDDDNGKSKDKNEKAVKASDRDDDDDDDDEKDFTRDEDDEHEDDEDEDEEDDDKQRIEVKIKKGTTKVKIKINDKESKLELGTTNLDRILAIIHAITGLDESEIRDIWEVEIKDKKDKVIICHFPPGNPSNAHTIRVGHHAAEKHQIKHGDTLGPCPDDGLGDGDISVHGVKYFDKDKDGIRDFGERALEGWEIVLKLSGITLIDSKFTNNHGEYWFEGLEEGTYEISEVLKPGWTQTQPFGGSYTAVLSSDSKIRQGFDFGNFRENLESNELFQNLSPNQGSSIQNSDDIIAQLLQRIEQLEQRLQTLLEKLENGKYYGNTLGGDPVIRSFGMSFDGSATSLTDSTIDEVTGEIFLESLITRDNTSKFRVMGGQISIGDTTHDIIFGKVRASSSGPSGEKDSMVLIAQLIDDEGIAHTIKLILDFEKSLEGNFGIEPMNFEIKPQSAVSNDWSISATGQFTVL